MILQKKWIYLKEGRVVQMEEGVALAPLGAGWKEKQVGLLAPPLFFDQVVGLNIEKRRVNFYKA